MKIKFHIPTEQFGFIEIEPSETETLSYAEAKALYSPDLSPTNDVGDGLPNKEWLKIVEVYLQTGELEGAMETWEKLNEYQRNWIQETKRALKRLKAHEE